MNSHIKIYTIDNKVCGILGLDYTYNQAGPSFSLSTKLLNDVVVSYKFQLSQTFVVILRADNNFIELLEV